MIDFRNAEYVKLRLVPDTDFAQMLSPLLTPGEEILSSCRSIRDGIVFTSKRMITINIQGVTGLPPCPTAGFVLVSSLFRRNSGRF